MLPSLAGYNVPFSIANNAVPLTPMSWNCRGRIVSDIIVGFTSRYNKINYCTMHDDTSYNLLRKVPSHSILPWQLFPESWFLQAMDPTKPTGKKLKYKPAEYLCGKQKTRTTGTRERFNWVPWSNESNEPIATQRKEMQPAQSAGID